MAQTDDLQEGVLERLWKVLLPCSYTLAMVERLSKLRGRPSGILDQLQLVYQNYAGLLEAYETELRSK
jgi:hypothetical protein